MNLDDGLVSDIYTKKDCIKKQSRHQRHKELLNVLARYLLVNGLPLKRVKPTYLYKYFHNLLDVDIPQEKQYWWLLSLAEFIEANEYKEFNLLDHKKQVNMITNKHKG